VEGIDFHAGIFTNLTQDHLDYHRNRENYFQAKAKLFKGLKANSLAILNYDDKYALRIRGLTEARPVGYSLEKKSEVMATKIEFGLGGSRFLFYFKGRRLGYIKTSLIGRHNIYNILAAAAFGLSEGIGFSLIQKAVATVGVVPGRLERIVARDGLNIFVDYAHTEDALRNVIQTLREVAGPQSRLLVVFGCGGERDKLKRPKMGRVVSEYADYAIITSDNPRSEEPLAIIEQIKRGITKHNYSVIPSRRQAIRESLRLARPTDMVLVAGKGHEGCQIFKGRIVRFDDRQVVRECLRQVNY
jgi:UDP-N-acetylmuramoyl-L-alanyl-D-glutamate--2,6-diaminopimelate ligase